MTIAALSPLVDDVTWVPPTRIVGRMFVCGVQCRCTSRSPICVVCSSTSISRICPTFFVVVVRWRDEFFWHYPNKNAPKTDISEPLRVVCTRVGMQGIPVSSEQQVKGKKKVDISQTLDLWQCCSTGTMSSDLPYSDCWNPATSMSLNSVRKVYIELDQ